MLRGGPLEPEDKRLAQKKETKKPYVKPAFRFETVFETQALSCGKISSFQGSCKVHKTS
ncbi:MAG: hypothetical protein ABSD75_21655 [Terriglobales bacterium]|jgi:hypothetical protein